VKLRPIGTGNLKKNAEVNVDVCSRRLMEDEELRRALVKDLIERCLVCINF